MTERRAAQKRKPAKRKGPPKNVPNKGKPTDCADEQPIVVTRRRTIPKDSYALANARIRTTTALDLPSVEGLSKAFEVNPKRAKELLAQLKETAVWLAKDKKRAEQFAERPVDVLMDRHPEVAQHLRTLHPNLLDMLLGMLLPSCADLPPPEEYADCVREILARVAAWMQQSATHRAIFQSTPDAAVDAAAPLAPAIAKMLAKQAINRAKSIQGGAS